MPSACGVSWDGTSSGELDKSAIPNDDFESHYLNDGDTKSESSFPVVDADGNLRAGNVNSAWDLRGRGEGVSEECLRKLDNAFEENVLPDSAYDNATRVSLDGNHDGAFGFNTKVEAPSADTLGDGFNEYGVRENEDGSIDVRFNAMEPGNRKGYDITKTFLRNAANKDYSRIPLQLDHSKSQRANVGYIEPDNIVFSDPFLSFQAHIPNTGASVREDVIADFTHEPPAINDSSISVDPKTVEVEAPAHENAAPKFVDGRIDEISLTPFPAGYDNGGLTPEFSEAVEKAVDSVEFDDGGGCGCGGGCGGCGSGGESQLIIKQFTIN